MMGVVTGELNAAFGQGSLRCNTSGNYNTAIGGGGTLCANTTGTNNTGVGFRALCSNTTANNNTAVGFQSLCANTTGGVNTTVGYKSMCSNTTGFDNTSFGSDSSQALTTGNSNTAVGRSSALALTTGSNNLLLGHDAGRATSPSGSITTQSNLAVYGDNNITDHYMAGDLRLTTGGLYVGGSADANKLDDYEEGDWTPTVGGNATYVVQRGRYTKIGNIVVALYQIQISVLGTGSNNQISGLPFTSENDTNLNVRSGYISYFANLAVSVGSIASYVVNNGTSFYFVSTTGDQVTCNNAPLVLGNSAHIYGTVIYNTA